MRIECFKRARPVKIYAALCSGPYYCVSSLLVQSTLHCCYRPTAKENDQTLGGFLSNFGPFPGFFIMAAPRAVTISSCIFHHPLINFHTTLAALRATLTSIGRIGHSGCTCVMAAAAMAAVMWAATDIMTAVWLSWPLPCWPQVSWPQVGESRL